MSFPTFNEPQARNVIAYMLGTSGEAAPTLALFNGGVIEVLPKIGVGGVTNTPQAFYTPAEDPKQSGKLKNTIAVIDGGDDPAPNGAARNGFSGFPLVYAYVAANPAGEAAITALDVVLRSLFRRGRSYPRADGGGMEIIVLERQPILDGDDIGYPGRIYTIWRLQATYVRPIV
jgi:hypothetical protein